jgi:hypothetical protein
MGFLCLFTQCQYRRLIFYYLYCYMLRPYDHLQVENMVIARVTQPTTDPLCSREVVFPVRYELNS